MSASGVFRDMLSVSEGGSAAAPKPIDIPAHSTPSGLFVKLVKHEVLDTSFLTLPETDPHAGSQGSIKCFIPLLDLLHRFDCAPGLHERVKTHFAPRYQFDPWPVFCAAAKYDDMSLAKAALRNFGDLPSHKRWTVDPLTMDPEQASQVPLNWFMGYCRAYAKHQGYTSEGPTLHDVSWKDVSETFAPAISRAAQAAFLPSFPRSTLPPFITPRGSRGFGRGRGRGGSTSDAQTNCRNDEK